MSVLRSEQLIETWTRKYVEGEIEVDALEEGIACALTGRADAATIAEAEAIRASRPVRDDWLELAHERRIRRIEDRVRGTRGVAI